MDVDNGSSDNPGTGNIDVEQSLLHQFSCMGTTDKDELVQQLQKVLGSQLNYNTAAFFLDMNNWNLQAAICSYFDVETPVALPSMALTSDPHASECENIEPHSNFQKSWHVLNNGPDPWPIGCHLQCATGDNFGANRVPVPCLNPGDGVMVTLDMNSPDVPGTYQSKWRLCTRTGSYFGDPMWVIITVVEEGTMALTQQLSHFSDLGAHPLISAPVNPFTQPRPPAGQSDDLVTDTDSNMC